MKGSGAGPETRERPGGLTAFSSSGSRSGGCQHGEERKEESGREHLRCAASVRKKRKREREVRKGKEELAKRQRPFLRRRAFQSGPALPFRLLRKPVPPIKARELDLSLGATGRRDPPEVVPYDLSFWTFRCRAAAAHLAGCRHASAFVSQSRALGRCVHMNQKKVTYGLLTVADVSDWQRTKKRQVVDRKKPVR